MDKELINEAGSQLNFDTVTIIESNFSSLPEYTSNYNEDCMYQTYNYAVSFDEFDSSDGKSFFYGFVYSVGYRIINKDQQADVENDDFKPLAEIQATYQVRYKSKTKVSEEALNEFGKFNVGYHVWPFWREYTQSTSLRMGIPVISIPPYRVDSQPE